MKAGGDVFPACFWLSVGNSMRKKKNNSYSEINFVKMNTDFI